jgi:beta-galactosidase
MSTESYTAPQRKAFRGRCMVVVRTTRESGGIRLMAEAEGLSPANIDLEAR